MNLQSTAPAPSRLYLRGVCLVLLAGVFLSSAGIIVRSIESADGWQILFYRSLSFVAMVFSFTLWNHRGRTLRAYRDIGWAGVVAALSLGCGFTFFLFGLLHTTVANLSFMLSASPFIAALLAWAVLGERVAKSTWLAIAAAVLGIGIMFADGLRTGHALGNLIAFGAPVTFAIMVVAFRSARGRDMTPATCLAGLVSAAIALVMADDLVMSAHDLGLAVLLGTFQVGMGFLLITLGARWVPAAQVALLSLTETVLAPIWVWIFLGEVPTTIALAGGLIVLTAVVGQGLLLLRQESNRASSGTYTHEQR